MPQIEEQKRAEAEAWFVRLHGPGDADWDGFTAWLEQDPAHDALYQEVALADAEYRDLAARHAAHAPSNDNQVIGGKRRLGVLAGWATAAVAAIGFGYPMLMSETATYAVETHAGERSSVRMDDGTRIELNGDTRLTLRKGDARFASLDRGQAVFTVTHDAAHPFEVHVGDDVYRDVGTVFDISRDKDAVATSVASGAVLYNPGKEAVRIDAGHMLTASAASSTVVLAAVEPASVATWRQDRLVYKAASLTKVAGDLSRNLGINVRVSPDIAERRFSGVIVLGGDNAMLLTRVANLLDVAVAHEGSGWRLSSRVRANR